MQHAQNSGKMFWSGLLNVHCKDLLFVGDGTCVRNGSYMLLCKQYTEAACRVLKLHVALS